VIPFLSKYRLTIIGVIIGAIGGYSYYHFYGCIDGCAIWSSPWRSTLYGIFFGGLIFNMIEDTLKNKKA
jgi:hypothetical protein